LANVGSRNANHAPFASFDGRLREGSAVEPEYGARSILQLQLERELKLE
jgi:hypothetical protein